MELIFAAHSTTASAATSLVLQLLLHPEVVERLRLELEDQNLISSSAAQACVEEERTADVSLEQLTQLGYLDRVIREVLRFLPPVSGGYRTVLQTFELDVSGSRKTCRPVVEPEAHSPCFYHQFSSQLFLILAHLAPNVGSRCGSGKDPVLVVKSELLSSAQSSDDAEVPPPSSC